MSTSFRAIIAEQDEEFVYYVKSIRNIHKDEVLDQIRLALLPFDLRSVEKAGWNPMSEKGSEMFPAEWTTGPVFSLKVTVGIDMDNERAIQKIALFTHINDEYLFVHKPGESQERMDNEDDEDELITVGYKALSHGAEKWDASLDKEKGVIDPEAQKYAGQQRIDNFMKELEADRKEREGSIKQPKIYEAFVTSHIALRDINGGSTPKKGYYLIERFEDDVSIMHISGPFQHQPVNYDFVPDMLKQGVKDFEFLGLGKVKLVEHDKNFRYTVDPLNEQLSEVEPYEVEVTDQDSGKVYHVVSHGVNKNEARKSALKIITRKENIDSSRLLAGEPEPARS